MQGSLLNYCHHSYFSHPPTWKDLSQPPGKMSSALAQAFSPSPRQHPIILRTPYLSLSFSVFTQQEPYPPAPPQAHPWKGLEPACSCLALNLQVLERGAGLHVWISFFCVVQPPLPFSSHSLSAFSSQLPLQNPTIALHFHFITHSRLQALQTVPRPPRGTILPQVLRKTVSWVRTMMYYTWGIRTPPQISETIEDTGPFRYQVSEQHRMGTVRE